MSIADLRPSPFFFSTRLLYEMGTRYGARRAEHAERSERLSKAALSRMPQSRLDDLGIDLSDLA
jgi:hypothetical protein